jgi:branched-chain amino acid aminotransferase
MHNFLCFINNRIIPYANARIHVSDLAFQRGYGIFDYFLEIEGKIPNFKDYLDRFYHSAAGLGLEVPLEREMLVEKILFLLDENKFRNSGIKLILSGGFSGDFYTPDVPNLVILNIPAKRNTELLENGIKLITHSYVRYLPEIKTLNYLPAILLREEMQKQGALDVLYHQRGLISETSRGNIFSYKDGKIYTPEKNILKGITRKYVLEIAKNHAEVIEGRLSLKDLAGSREVFVTGTSKPVAPVIKIGNDIIADGKPGPFTLKLNKLYEEFLLGQD